MTGSLHVLENLENNKFIFHVLEFYKIRKCSGKVLPVKKNPLRTKYPANKY